MLRISLDNLFPS